MLKKKFDIVVVGELNVDLILNEIDTFPRMGAEILAQDMALTLGSSSAILASNISTLGLSTSFIGKIGEDIFGDLVLTSLQRKNVDTSLVQRSSRCKTGATIVLNYDNDRAMVTHAGAMEEMETSDIKVEDLLLAGHMHVSSVFLQPGIKKDIVSLFEQAKNLGLTTSLDPQWDPFEKWDIDFEKLLPFVDVFFPNISELMAITGKDELSQALDCLLPFANIIALKLGKEGSTGYKNGINIHAKPFVNEDVIDAIGAGDSFNAGFLSAFIQKLPLEECLKRGNIMGAVNTTGVGGIGAFLSLENVRKVALEKFHYGF